MDECNDILRIGTEQEQIIQLYKAVKALSKMGVYTIMAGVWNETTNYNKKQTIVTYNNSSYIKRIDGDCVNESPSLNPDKWQLIAAQGTAGLNYKGEWVSGDEVIKDDVYSYNGSSYVANESGITTAPELNSGKWGLIAAQGLQGAPGKGFPGKGFRENPIVITSSKLGTSNLELNFTTTEVLDDFDNMMYHIHGTIKAADNGDYFKIDSVCIGNADAIHGVYYGTSTTGAEYGVNLKVNRSGSTSYQMTCSDTTGRIVSLNTDESDVTITIITDSLA